MSGDSIASLKMVKEQPLNQRDVEYTQRLLEPFEDVIIERFNAPSTPSVTIRSKIFRLIAIGLILILNFPKVKEKLGLNDYIIWLITVVILFGVFY